MMEVGDNNNHYSNFTNLCNGMDKNTGALARAVIPFVFQKDAASFVLILPDDTHFPLDPIR
ncbi:MAG: hypothetical protein ABSC61_02960 [Anaerolineales bacterium]